MKNKAIKENKMLIQKWCGCIIKKTMFSLGSTVISCGRPTHVGITTFILNKIDAKPIKTKDLLPEQVAFIMKQALTKNKNKVK